MTEELYREDAYLQQCEAEVVLVDGQHIILDRTVFYPEGGGQPGDTGSLLLPDGSRINIINTRKDPDGRGICHVLEVEAATPTVGDKVTVEIDWDRRHKHMRMHSCLHLLCSLVEGGVTGGSISQEKSRLDFDLQDTSLDKELLTRELNRLIQEDHSLSSQWITDAELAQQPELVRTMSVKPPTGQGQVRLMNIEGIDLQPCGGTHVRSTAEIGAVRVSKIENKGKHNRRINILFEAGTL